MADAIENVHRIMTDATSSPRATSETQNINKKLVWYGTYIKKRYLQLRVSYVSNQWLTSPTQKIFNLSIIKEQQALHGQVDDEFVHMNIRGEIDDILLKKSPIKLEDIFLNIEGERKVILIDGAPGSGKSTLTCHICQKWSAGELFQEFTVVILVQLRDPVAQRTQTIAELLPCRDDEMAVQVEKIITETDGRGVLWVLDGWDELPLSLQRNSLLRDIIIPPTKSPITQSSVIVTSRPVSSGDLNVLVSSRIEVLGFSLEQRREYFAECLKGDTEAVDAILKQLDKNPAIEGSCYLPLNASIVAHLYLTDGSLPTTVYEMFSYLVQHFLSRFLCERLGRTREQACLHSLNELPQELQAPFNQICQLAFMGTMKNKVTFSHSELLEFSHSDILCEIGLLQAMYSITSNGRSAYYHFIHLSVQELLTAINISHMPASQQISIFNSLFGESRFISVFHYYAAITKLRTSKTFLSKLPSWLLPVPVCVLDIVRKIARNYRNRTLLVSLLHCLYEAQDPCLCKFVVDELNGDLDLRNTSLTPVDCLVIGFFIFSVTFPTSKCQVFRIDLYNCSLGDTGLKNLAHAISNRISPNVSLNTHISIDLSNNMISEEGATHIASMLNCNFISTLCIGYIEGNPVHDKGLQTIFAALKRNNTLQTLYVCFCGMTDNGLASLTDALSENVTLKELLIHGNTALTEIGLTRLVEVLSRNSGIVKLSLPGNFIKSETSIQKIINKTRKRREMAAIEVVGELYYTVYQMISVFDVKV